MVVFGLFFFLCGTGCYCISKRVGLESSVVRLLLYFISGFIL
jgi:hypothetical protein